VQCYCFSVACQLWMPQPNTNYADGRPNPAQNLHQCQAACLGVQGCNGFDWVPTERVGQQCWLSGTWSGARGTPPGVTHYVLNRNCGGNEIENVLSLWNKLCKAYKQRTIFTRLLSHSESIQQTLYLYFYCCIMCRPLTTILANTISQWWCKIRL